MLRLGLWCRLPEGASCGWTRGAFCLLDKARAAADAAKGFTNGVNSSSSSSGSRMLVNGSRRFLSRTIVTEVL